MAPLCSVPPASSSSLSPPVCAQAADLVVERSAACKPKPHPSGLLFGKQFSDHMLTIDWTEGGGWEAPQVKPFQNLSLHPACSALHYSVEVRTRVGVFLLWFLSFFSKFREEKSDRQQVCVSSAALRGHEGVSRRRQPHPSLQTHDEHGADAPQRRPELPAGESHSRRPQARPRV